MYFAAIDGGGSKTVAVVNNHQGTALAYGSSGCGNYQVCGLEAALQAIESALQKAVKFAGISLADLCYIQYSLAGADSEIDDKFLLPSLARIPVKAWSLTSDAWSSLRLATVDGSGVALICGSGTNCVARWPGRNPVQIGGYGYLLGDVAGGTALAQRAFHKAVRSFEGREAPTQLVPLILRYFGLETMDGLIRRSLEEAWHHVPSDLALLVHEACAQGDELASSLLSESGEELGKAAVAAMRKLGLENKGAPLLRNVPAAVFGVDEETIPVVLTGSILQKGRSPVLLTALYRTIAAAGLPFQLRLPLDSPVYGAALMAADALHLPMPQGRYLVVNQDGSLKESEEE